MATLFSAESIWCLIIAPNTLRGPRSFLNAFAIIHIPLGRADRCRWSMVNTQGCSVSRVDWIKSNEAQYKYKGIYLKIPKLRIQISLPMIFWWHRAESPDFSTPHQFSHQQNSDRGKAAVANTCAGCYEKHHVIKGHSFSCSDGKNSEGGRWWWSHKTVWMYLMPLDCACTNR